MKITILQKSIYSFNAIPIKILTIYFTEKILKFIWNQRRHWIAKAILYKKNTGRIAIPDLEICYGAIKMKATWHCHEHSRPVEQNWDANNSIVLVISVICYLTKRKKALWRKDRIFSKWCWEKLTSTCRKVKLNPYLSLCTEIRCKWVKTSIWSPNTKLLKENIDTALQNIDKGNTF